MLSVAFLDPSTVIPDPSTTTLTPLQCVIAILAFLGASSVLLTMIGQALAICATRYPSLTTASHLFLAWGYDVQKFSDKLKAATEAKAALLSGAAASSRPPAPTNDNAQTRGFSTVHAIVALAAACLLACAGALAAVPAISTTAVCIYDYVKANPGLTLVEYTAQCALACGADALSILDALIASTDPSLASLRDEAKALRAAGGPKLEEFVGSVHARMGAIRADGGRP